MMLRSNGGQWGLKVNGVEIEKQTVVVERNVVRIEKVCSVGRNHGNRVEGYNGEMVSSSNW